MREWGPSAKRMGIALVSVVSLAWAVQAGAEALPFKRALELAVQHSPGTAIAASDQQRAQKLYEESRNLYYPSLTLGAGLGYTYGFPLSLEGSAPSIFNLNTQSLILNPARSAFTRALKQDWHASTLQSEDQRNQVMLETAVTYLQLDTLTSKLHLQEEQKAAAQNMVRVMEERVHEGVDSPLELNKTKLAAARVELRIADARGEADVLRQRLSQLTGLPVGAIETVTESVPALPEVKQEDDLVAKALQANPSVKVAEEKAAAQELRAHGEHRSMYPQIDFAGQYAVLARYNNYQDFFFQNNNFRRNNLSIGLVIRLPFLNASQHAHAGSVDAEAVRAKKEAEVVKNQLSTDTLRLQRSVQQLDAAKTVADLEYKVASAQADAVKAKADTGAVGPEGTPATLRDLDTARLEATRRYEGFLDASLALDKARLELLQATGELGKWADLGK